MISIKRHLHFPEAVRRFKRYDRTVHRFFIDGHHRFNTLVADLGRRLKILTQALPGQIFRLFLLIAPGAPGSGP